jgi:hypothetical protein
MAKVVFVGFLVRLAPAESEHVPHPEVGFVQVKPPSDEAPASAQEEIGA